MKVNLFRGPLASARALGAKWLAQFVWKFTGRKMTVSKGSANGATSIGVTYASPRSSFSSQRRYAPTNYRYRRNRAKGHAGGQLVNRRQESCIDSRECVPVASTVISQ